MAEKRKPRGVYLDPGLIQSKAYLALSGTASKVLLWFMCRRQMSKVGRKGKEKWVISNNGKIIFTYSEAESKFKLTRPRFQRAIDDLLEKGFIDINHLGGGMVKDMTTYYISERWRNYETPKFKEVVRPKDTRGLGYTPENWEEKSKKKRRSKSKIGNENVTRTSNKNVTASRGITHAPSNKNVTEEIDPNFFICKGEEVFQYFQPRSNKNITIL